MLTNKSEGSLSLDEKEKRKYLFLRQVETLDSFLANGAISHKQYDFSYSGLVTKMNITEKELEEWLKN
jgi:tRNA A37 threonylcarbamoyltransferase TsaD